MRRVAVGTLGVAVVIALVIVSLGVVWMGRRREGLA